MTASGHSCTLPISTRSVVAARCCYLSKFNYKSADALDLSAVDMLKNKAELEKLLEYVQKNAKAVLLSIEKDITEIQRRAIYERGNQADLVRGGQDVLPRNQGGERQEVSARPADVRVSGGAVARSDGRGAGADEQADRVLRQEVAGVYGGELSSGHSGAEGQNVVGADTEADRQGSRGNGVEFGAGVREEQSPSAHVSRNSAVGEDEVARSQSQSDDGNRPQTARINNSAEADKAPADFVSEKSFAEQVDEVLNGTASRYNDLKVCDTPQILLDVGCEQLPIFYTQRHLNDAIKIKGHSGESVHHHGLDIKQIKNIPSLLREPVAVYDSLSRDDSIVVLTSELDKDNCPIIAVLKPDGQAKYNLEIINSNFLLSVYGHENIENQLNRAMESDKLLFIDKIKSQELFRVLGLQLSKGVNSLDFNIIIHQSRNIVKGFEEKISEDSQNFEQITLDSAPERATYSTNPTAAEPVNEEPPADLDKFYVNPETEQVTWFYYNPDSSAGGQLVYTYFDFDDILTASEKDNPLDYLLETSKQTVLDKGMDGFDEAVAEFMTNSESISNRDENYLEKLIALSEQKKNRATYSTIPAEFDEFPTITCDWSESEVFEDGKTYSVLEFDELMKRADIDWIAARKQERDSYGEAYEAIKNGEIFGNHQGYAKTKFTVNLPNGDKITERQDIGDGYGGVIDFLSQYGKYNAVSDLLRATAEIEKIRAAKKICLAKRI